MDVIYGRNPVTELLKTDGEIDKIYVNKEISDPSLKAILAKAGEKRIVISYCTKQKLNELCETTKHQGIAALIPRADYVSLKDIIAFAGERGEDPFIFIADEITDPHNLGAIIRTANVCGAHGVIIPKRRNATLTSTVAKASAGAVSVTKIARVNNLHSAIEELKKNNIWVYGLEADGEQYYFDADLTGPIAVVVGSEGSGMNKLIRESCDAVLKIPVKGEINSLNASVAAGVLAYEIVRQREKNNA